jgi:hypothetical protein
MANNYFQFSEFLTFKTEEAADLFMKVAQVLDLIEMEDFDPSEPDDRPAGCDAEIDAFLALPEDDRAAILESLQFGSFDCDRSDKSVPASMKNTVWVWTDEYGNMDLVGYVAAAALDVTGDHETVFTLTGAGTCSRPITGEFGGAWIAVSSKIIRGGDTWTAADEMAQRIRDGKEEA